MLLCLELMLAAPLWARIVAARRIGAGLDVSRVVLVLPAEYRFLEIVRFEIVRLGRLF